MALFKKHPPPRTLQQGPNTPTRAGARAGICSTIRQPRVPGLHHYIYSMQYIFIQYRCIYILCIYIIICIYKYIYIYICSYMCTYVSVDKDLHDSSTPNSRSAPHRHSVVSQLSHTVVHTTSRPLHVGHSRLALGFARFINSEFQVGTTPSRHSLDQQLSHTVVHIHYSPLSNIFSGICTIRQSRISGRIANKQGHACRSLADVDAPDPSMRLADTSSVATPVSQRYCLGQDLWSVHHRVI